jgi:hypothetical protein
MLKEISQKELNNWLQQFALLQADFGPDCIEVTGQNTAVFFANLR